MPEGFRPQSVTFVSAADGWVLGTAPCSHAVCTSVVRTTDSGRTWTGIPAPVEALGSRPGPGQGSGLTTLRFANTRDGYAFGDRLWMTTDGGAHWARRRLPGAGRIQALTASAGSVYLLLVPAGGSTGTAALYRAPAGSTRWTRVFATPLRQGETLRLRVHGQRVWLLDGGGTRSGTLYRSSDAGAHWTHAAAPCPQYYLPAGLAVATNGSYVALACIGNGAAGSVSKHVYVSTDAGRRFAATAGDPSRLGDTAHLAVPAAGTIVVGSASAATVLDASFDGGAHWATVFRSNTGGQPLHDLGFTTAQQGVVVEGVAAQAHQPSQLYMTRDGGQHWSAVTF